MIWSQVGIAVCGITAVWLSQDERVERRRWASVMGLLGQPFWAAETIAAGQWGILVLVALYTWSWARGLHTHWIKPRRDAR